MESQTGYHAVVQTIIVKPITEPLFGEYGTEIRMDDEGGGAFVSLYFLDSSSKENIIPIDHDEWLIMKKEIDKMFREIKKHGL